MDEPGAAPVDAVIIGAGFAGLYAHHRLRALGLTLRGYEAAADVGGTWWWNRYPGARCDVESLDYNYSFSDALLDEWRWSERFATQPEILRYAEHVAERFDLKRDIAFSTRIVSARFDGVANLWTVRTDRGEQVRCRWLIAATGSLSLPKRPDFAGLESFAGAWFQTGAWPHEGVDFTGKRVVVIGTGSSGIQAIPHIARDAARLTVFQRTANYSVPAHNGPARADHAPTVLADFPAHHRAIRRTRGGQVSPLNTGLGAFEVSDEERHAKFEAAWGFGTFALQSVFRDLTSDERANAEATAFVHEKIRAVVHDPVVADRLTPRGYPFGTKRLCLDTDYYATFNRGNVELVDIRETPIERITTGGIRTSDADYPADIIVFAIGFDAMTGPLLALGIENDAGLTLKQAWADGPVSYLGIMIAGFPNLFTVNGPSSPSVLTNMIVSIEHHVDFIADAIAHMRANGFDRMEPDAAAERAWAAEVAESAGRTLFPAGNSWYMGANVPGKPRLFMAYIAGFDSYADRCAAIVAADYDGFYFA